MTNIRVVFFTETNSLFGAPLFRRLVNHPEVDLVGLVVREPGKLCDYYFDDPEQVDLADEGLEHGVHVLRPHRLNSPEVITDLTRLSPDYFLVGNYQQVLRRQVLDIPRIDTINFHPSPLPKYAGLAPFYWMAKAGETEGGVSAIRMNEALDDGPIVAQQLLQLAGTESERDIRDSHFEASWRLFDLVLPTLIDRTYRTVEQVAAERTYFGRPPAHSVPTSAVQVEGSRV